MEFFLLRRHNYFNDADEKIEFRNGREFLMSVNDRLNQMKAAVQNDMTEFKKELELKEEDRYTETKKEIANLSQNCLREDNFTDIPGNILQIYLPDDATIARELWRIKEYADELETIKEETEEELYKGNTGEDIKPKFASGAEYLDWLDRQLPYLEPFLPENADHVYFFRRWSREDFRYSPWLETLFEEEPRKLTTENNEDDIEPEFASGEEYLGWLGRQLPCLEPFVNDDTIHACYEFEWRKRNDYAPRLNTVIEETEEELNEKIIDEDIKPEFASGAEYLAWLDRQLPYLEPFLPENADHFYFFRRWSRDDFKYTPRLETHFEEEPGGKLTAENNKEDIEPEFASGEEYLGWLGRQLLCLEPFVGDDTIHASYEFEWQKRNDYTPRLNTVIEENVNEEQKKYRVCSSKKDTRELEDEDVNPYIKLMLQPTVFCMEVLTTQDPLSLADICTQMIPTEQTTDTGHPEYETNLTDTEKQTEQVCQKASKWNLSFKFLCRNKNIKERKKRALGFFSRFFH
ncbi:uncharacterized protein LOC133179205 [Saccostrea echinata]|uniref:uncharacterized protein LOC133179205 n=1 Tax=Saccostrea echinata TaxID=191078 RepID=UPI002A83FA7B|nr:uncharacterized protein LOC133179205 [Saccostrea echinata]